MRRRRQGWRKANCGSRAKPEPVPLPMTSLGDLGSRGLLHRDINGKELNRDGLPRGPFDIAQITDSVPTWPALWGHDASRETRMVVAPDQQGLVRPGCDARAVQAWERTASRLHFSLDFRVNSQPLAACLTPELNNRRAGMAEFPVYGFAMGNTVGAMGEYDAWPDRLLVVRNAPATRADDTYDLETAGARRARHTPAFARATGPR